MTLSATRQQRRELARQNAKQPTRLTPVPVDLWSESMLDSKSLMQVWRSRSYLVQAFEERDGVIRLSINKTVLVGDRWDDGLVWDELQEIKRQCGFGDKYAIEIYPRDKDVVNVANMRHLWIMDEPLNIGWVRK
jgi:hypothetical protein